MYGDKVRIVWKHLPLDMHKNAMSAHLAAVAAEKQGKFWEFHDKLFANQQQLNLDAYKRCAREPKLEVARFEKDLVELENKRKIDEDKAEATAMGITGTPGFFVRQLQLVEDEEGREGAEWLADAQAAIGGRPEVGAVVVPSGKNGFDVCLLSLAHHPERPSMTRLRCHPTHAPQSSFLNSSIVRPASMTIPPIVKALTGL